MIDTAKLKEALARDDDNRTLDDWNCIDAAARLVLAAQAAPGEVEAGAIGLYQHARVLPGDAPEWEDASPEVKDHVRNGARIALLAAALHRPFEARVTEEAVRVASATLEQELERCGIITTVTPMIARLVLEAASLPSPQVTFEEVYSLIMKHEKATFGHIAWPRLLADRIIALFDGKAKP